MNISSFFSSFFNSYLGMFMAQAFCHSIIAFIVVDRAVYLWSINNPLIRQRFHLIVVLLPVFSFPLYQIINPDRGSISFRLGALFDINRWLTLELWGTIPLGLFFITIIIITTIIFIFQEMLPILKHTVESRRSDIEAEEADDNSVVGQAIENLPVEKPDVFVLDDDDYVLFSTTGKNASVYLSTGIIKKLNAEQLRAAIAHEIAHIMRNKRPLLIVVFLFRMIMFFNLVVLLEFRRLVQEEEKICDDMAVAFTKNPRALSEALKKLYHKNENNSPLQLKKLSEMKDSIEEYSHNVHIENRMHRLESGGSRKTDGEWFKLILTIIVITGINYFVV
ncbi:MAG: M48 family metalloprotease [Nitrospirae bacterium]|nr:M48 family metalloprotease [Nitrospirota bacterium]MCL5237578.1 M48 family metalloprotease [Nitrospirota bacterium]